MILHTAERRLHQNMNADIFGCHSRGKLKKRWIDARQAEPTCRGRCTDQNTRSASLFTFLQFCLQNLLCTSLTEALTNVENTTDGRSQGSEIVLEFSQNVDISSSPFRSILTIERSFINFKSTPVDLISCIYFLRRLPI